MPTINGTAGDDTLVGEWSVSNWIYGEAGNDLIHGGDEDDWLYGGEGDDVIHAGDGYGFYLADHIFDGPGNDQVYGGLGDDIIFGSPGNDFYDGGADESGTDAVFYSDAKSGIIVDLRLATGQVRSSLASDAADIGVDTLVNVEQVAGSNFDDIMYAGSEGSWLLGAAGNDQLIGGDGNDTLGGGLGDDLLIGGEGTDAVDYERSATGVTVSFAIEGPQDTGEGIDTLVGFEWLFGSWHDDVLIGNDGRNVIIGVLGSDRIFGGAGDDWIEGGMPQGGWVEGIAGNYLDGGAGDDFIRAMGDGPNVVIGGSGKDTIWGGYNGDIFIVASAAEHEAAEFNSGGGLDEVRFTATGTAQTLKLFAGDIGISRIVIGTGTAANAVSTGLLAHNVDARLLGNGVTITGNSGAKILYATSFTDTVQAGNGDDRIYGYAGNDLLDGGRGLDVMYGGAGDDIYVVDHASDAPIELAGEGTDTVLASVAHTLKANVEHLTITGAFSVHGRGNALDNTLTGNSGSNRFWGEGGNDTLIGNAGADQLDGGAGDDTLIGGSGNDIYFVDSEFDTVTEADGEGRDTVRSSIDWTLGENLEWLELQGSAAIDGTGNALANVLKGNSGSNVLVGPDGNDKLFGNEGSDRLYGGNGNDWLEGGSGRDIFSGGTGSDRFVFRDGDFGGASFSTADAIQEFGDIDGDRIHLSLVDANTTMEGDQSFAWTGGDAFSGTAGELRYEQLNGDTLVSGDTDGDGIADFMIRLVGSHDLGTDDFIF